jgi:hypothetical protein
MHGNDTPHPLDQPRAILSAAFGDDWEMFLMAQGVVGGTSNDEIHADHIEGAPLSGPAVMGVLAG